MRSNINGNDRDFFLVNTVNQSIPANAVAVKAFQGTLQFLYAGVMEGVAADCCSSPSNTVGRGRVAWSFG